MQLKIVSIVGARPQFIKAASVSREIRKRSYLREIIIHTGQHFDQNMSEVFFQEMEIPNPNYNLDINGLNHGAMTGQMMEKIESVLIDEKPDVILVYGDTNSTLAGAIAAKKLHIQLCHIEAGLRSFNLDMPEEINRILTDRISDILFCPSETAVKNLANEGFHNFGCKIVNSGDVMFDSMIFYSKKSADISTIIKRLNLEAFILCTVHRAENTDDIQKLSSIVSALNQINENIKVVLPLHPRTKKILEKNNLKTNFMIINPVGYFDMIELIKHSSIVITDSGGLQKEAFFLQKHCVTLRNETEWMELVDNGFNVIAGTDEKKIIDKVGKMLHKKSDFSVNLYGSGDASKTIVETFNSYLES